MAKRDGRLIIIAGDGMDPGIVDGMIREGRLPCLASLTAGGQITRLATTAPPQSPVAWTTALTGVNPGRHGIFDFLRRDPATYTPSLALYDKTDRGYMGRRKAPLVTECLSRAGVSSLLLRVPGTFPPKIGEGNIVCGQGTPDLAGAWGRAAIYDSMIDAETGSVMGVRLMPLGRTAEGFSSGMAGPLGRSIKLELAPLGPDKAALFIDGGRIELIRGRLSDWVSVNFSDDLQAGPHGLVRFTLMESGDEPRLHRSAIMVDPKKPAFPVSEPAGLSAFLAEAFGDYPTLGWAEDTWSLAEGHVDFEDFLAEIERNLDQFERMAWWAIAEAGYDFVLACFEHTDRIAHLFGHLADAGHPRHDVEAARRFSAELNKAYQRLDAFIGKVLRAISDRDTLIVMSDHGFSPFCRQVNINSWLAGQGYLALKEQVGPEMSLDSLFDRTCFLSNVAWEGTRAYNIGLGSIYLNLEGREQEGIVAKGRSSERLIEEISARLLDMVDGTNAGSVVARVVRPDREMWGTALVDAPDLIVGFGRGYRTAWQSSLGGLSPHVIFENRGPWASDHCASAPELVPGLIASNRKIREKAPDLADIGATILAGVGLEPDEPLDGLDVFTEQG